MTAQMTDAMAKMIKARINMLVHAPFFGDLALRLRLVEDKVMTAQYKTLATDGRTIWFHPDWVEKNDHSVIQFGVAHEVMHAVFNHMVRRAGRDPSAWNAAGDFAINLLLKDAGFTLWDKALLDEQYRGQSADEIYNSFPPGARASMRGFDELKDAPNEDGSARDPSDGVSEAEAQAHESDWSNAVIAAAQNAKSQGKLPGSLERFIDEMISEKVDWKAVLRRFITEVAKDDYAWQRPNRRMMAAGYILPGLYSESMGDITVIIDTSGSIGQETLNLFGGEINSIRANVRPTSVRVIYCDARVNHVDEFDVDDQVELKAHGGGGTDFRPPFEWLEERGIVPKCAVYLTDMYGTFPEHEPPYPVLWAAISDVEAPWGETLRIED